MGKICYIAHQPNSTNGWGRVTRSILASATKCELPHIFLAKNDRYSLASLTTPVGDTRLKPLCALFDTIVHRTSIQTCSVIHCLTEPMIPFALQAHRQFKIPLVLNLYGTYAIKTLSGSLASVYKRAYQAADVIIVPSEHTAQQLSSVFPEVQSKIEILPLASSFETATNILPFDKRQRSAVFVGEIKKRKGVFELLQATKLAIDQDQLDALYVVGNICDENYYTQLLTYVEKEHLSSNITFCGKVSDDELSKLYSKSRASVLPSISDGAAFEGLGLVHLESFAYGTPSIGSRNSGSECAISDGKNGLLVSQGDVSKLAASLASLLNDESRWTKFSQNALAKTNSWQNVLNSYKALYDSLEIS